MKLTITEHVNKEIDIRQVHVWLPVRFEDEDMPYDFPMRAGDEWAAYIDIETGVIQDWPKGKTGSFYLKVTDMGCYTLFGPDHEMLAERNDYVPHGVIPGEYGDYVDFEIDENGKITNWRKPQHLDFSAFFPDKY